MPVCTTPAWFPSFGSLLVSKHFQCLSEDPKLSWFEQDFCRCSPFVRICEPARQSGFSQGDVTDEASGGVHNKMKK